MAKDRTAGRPAGSPLREQLQGLIEKHGIEAVTEALMKVLEKHFRRQDLKAAAKRLNLVPHTVGQSEIKGRMN